MRDTKVHALALLDQVALPLWQLGNLDGLGKVIMLSLIEVEGIPFFRRLHRG